MADFKLALFHSGVVGSWLVTVNQGTAILQGAFDGTLSLRIFLDYATPFTVSSCTSLLRNRSDRLDESKPKPWIHQTSMAGRPLFDGARTFKSYMLYRPKQRRCPRAKSGNTRVSTYRRATATGMSVQRWRETHDGIL